MHQNERWSQRVPIIDYWLGNLLQDNDEERMRIHHIEEARQLSFSVVHWLQTDAPRPDGGHGWPGLRVRVDVRATDWRSILVSGNPAVFGLGIGYYRIDLHPSTGRDNYVDLAARAFQIPLGPLIPVRVENLLPAAKNIGTTHITNGCYRLHPIGRSGGAARP